MPALVTRTDLENARADVQTVSDVVNGAANINGTGLVQARLGGSIKTLAKLLQDLSATATETTAIQAKLDAEAARNTAVAAAATAAADVEAAIDSMRDEVVAAKIAVEAIQDALDASLPSGAALAGKAGRIPRVNAGETAYDLVVAPVYFYGLRLDADANLILEIGDENFVAEEYIWYDVLVSGLTFSIDASGNLVLTSA